MAIFSSSMSAIFRFMAAQPKCSTRAGPIVCLQPNRSTFISPSALTAMPLSSNSKSRPYSIFWM
jgi:hypothetical protein